MRATFYGEVVAVQPGQYTLYVFKNLDEQDDSLLRYITVTKVPNWNCKELNLGDKGYLECEYVNAGDNYYQVSTNTIEKYNYTVCYLINFIEKQEDIKQKEFNF